jgi:ubiquinone/menaquinone biosynthesis C-methylase UbiE
MDKDIKDRITAAKEFVQKKEFSKAKKIYSDFIDQKIITKESLSSIIHINFLEFEPMEAFKNLLKIFTRNETVSIDFKEKKFIENYTLFVLTFNLLAKKYKKFNNIQLKILRMMLPLNHDRQELKESLAVAVIQVVEEFNSEFHEIELNNSNFLNLIRDNIVIYSLLNNAILSEISEDFFINLRKKILVYFQDEKLEIQKIDGLRKLIFSIQQNCFLNEYVWDQTEDEIEILKKIEKRIITRITNNKEISSEYFFLIASYYSLNESKKIIKNYLRYKAPHKDNLLNLLVKNQITNLEEEKEIGKAIPNSSLIINEISKKVKSQYEENPYPRWEHIMSRGQQSYLDLINININPNKIKDFTLKEEINLLVAGCGTGYQPISIAQIDKSIKIDAFDLSRASLAYGLRKSKELSIKNIHWFQSDILEIDNTKKQYSIIECSGVLHHMEDPIKGFNILSKKLKPEGLLKIGLYSKSFRENRLKKSQELLSKKFKSRDIKSIRLARKYIKKMDGEKIKLMPDFYSSSSFRDLLMHEQEKSYDLNEIKKIFEKDYNFLGFIFDKGRMISIQNEYQSLFPKEKTFLDFSCWQIIEKKYPDLFSGMYQFWLQKK